MTLAIKKRKFVRIEIMPLQWSGNKNVPMMKEWEKTMSNKFFWRKFQLTSLIFEGCFYLFFFGKRKIAKRL